MVIFVVRCSTGATLGCIGTLEVAESPTSITIDITYRAALILMDEKEIDHLVVVDNRNVVVDLYHRMDLTPILLSVPLQG